MKSGKGEKDVYEKNNIITVGLFAVYYNFLTTLNNLNHIELQKRHCDQEHNSSLGLHIRPPPLFCRKTAYK